MKTQTTTRIPIYSDSATVNASYFGFLLTFGSLLTVTTEDGSKKAMIDKHVTVGMSPEHAKSLCDLLSSQLEKYEESFGPIRPIPAPLGELKTQ